MALLPILVEMRSIWALMYQKDVGGRSHSGLNRQARLGKVGRPRELFFAFADRLLFPPDQLLGSL